MPRAHQLEDLGEQRHVRTGEHAQRDHVDVLLHRGLHHLLRRLVEPGVDDLHAGVAQRGGHDLRPAIVSIESGLAHQHADLALHEPSGSLAPWRDVRKPSAPSGRGRAAQH